MTAKCIARPGRARIHGQRALALVVSTITVAVLAAGCGTSSQTSSATPRPVAAFGFAKCMRGHGVPSFPDPGSGLSGPSNSIGSIEIPSTIDIQAPAFQAAQSACRGFLSAALSREGRPGVPGSVKAAIIAHVQCMRTHGVPDFPDPKFPTGGGIAITDAGTNPQSPAYQHAQSVCAPR